MSLSGQQVGSLVGLHGLPVDPEPGDLSVLRILANQAAVSLHTSEQYRAGLSLHRRAQRLYDEARARARDLEVRTGELRRAEYRLVLAHQRELIDTERHRIARELHDSVTQYVLSAGMAVEVARGEAEGLRGAAAATILERLTTAKQLSQEAVEQLRRAQAAQRPPERDPRRRGLARKSIGHQDPLRHRRSLARGSGNRGCSPPSRLTSHKM
jgi:signal transduction histidine kinase